MAAALFCAGFGYFAFFHRLGWFLQDDGVLFYQYLRTYRGQLPYRDFFTGYGPVTLYLHAALFSLFGPSVEATRLLMAVVNALSGVFLYAVTRRVAPRALALVPALLFFSMQPGDIASMAFHNTPYPLWYAVTLMSGGTWAMLRTLEAASAARRAGWLVAVGVLGAVTFLVKQNAGIYFLWGVTGYLVSYPAVAARDGEAEPRFSRWLRVAYLSLIPLASLVVIKNFIRLPTVALFVLPTAVLLLVGMRRPFAPLAGKRLLADLGWVALGAVVAVAPWVVYFGSQMGFGAFLKALFLVGVDVDRNLYLPFPPPSPVTQWVLFLMAAGAYLFRLANREANEQRLHRAATRWLQGFGRQLLYLLLAFVVLWIVGHEVIIVQRFLRLEYNLWQVYWITSTALDNLVSYLVLVVLGAGVVVVWRQARGALREGDPEPHRFLCVLWIAACTVILYYPRMDAAHLVAAAALVYVAGMGLLEQVRVRVAAAVRGDGRYVRWAFNGALALGIAFVVGWKLAPKVYSRVMLARTGDGVALVSTPTESLQLDNADIYFPVYEKAQRLPIQAFREIIAYIRQTTREDEPIFTFPALPLVYFFAGRHNPTRHDYFLGNNVSLDEQAELIRTLERAEVPLIVLPSDANDYFLRKARDFTRLLTAYFNQRYYLERRVGPFDVLRRYGTEATSRLSPTAAAGRHGQVAESATGTAAQGAGG